MADPRNCPACGLVNAPRAVRCDCGYEFASHPTGTPPTSFTRPNLVSLRQAKVESAVMGCVLLASAPITALAGLCVSVVRIDWYNNPLLACGVFAVAVLLAVVTGKAGVYLLSGSSAPSSGSAGAVGRLAEPPAAADRGLTSE